MNQIPNLGQIVTAHDPHYWFSCIAVFISVGIDAGCRVRPCNDKVENILAQSSSAQPFLC